MTGNEIRALRKGFGWSYNQFARLMGAGSAVTGYRWEAAKDNPASINGAYRRTMAGIVTLRDKIDAEYWLSVGEEIVHEMSVRGDLYAYHVLLCKIFDQGEHLTDNQEPSE